MNGIRQVVTFYVDGISFAADVDLIEYIIRAVKIDTIPGAPQLLLGVINYHGVFVPVINFRHRLRLKEREVSSKDFIIIAKMNDMRIAFAADEITGYREIDPSTIKNVHELWKGISRLESITRQNDEFIVITDLGHFLNADESLSLSALLSQLHAQTGG